MTLATPRPDEDQGRFLVLSEAMPQVVWSADATGSIDYYNRFAFDYAGVAMGDIAGWKWERVIHPDDLARTMATWRRALATGKAFENEHRLRRADGEYRWHLTRGVPIRGDDGRVARWIGAATDIHDLRVGRQKQAALLATIQSGYWLFDLDGRLLEVNGAYCRMSGYTRDELLRMRVEDLDADETPDQVRAHIRAVAARGHEEFQARHRRKDGTVYPVEILASYLDADGGRMVVFARDVTDRLHDQEELRRSEERFRLLSRTAEVLLASADPLAVVERLCGEVMRHLDCHVFFNYLDDPAAGRLHLNACAGIPAEEARRIEWLDHGVAVCGCVAREGARIVAEDIARSEDPRTALVRGYGIQAYCCHPLLVRGRPIGTLSFGTRTRTTFAPDEIEVMRSVADQVAVAMLRVQAERDLRALNATLEARVRERTAQAVDLADQLRALAAELAQVERRERRRLATMLHDHLQQLLVAAQLRVGLARRAPDPEGAAAALEATDGILKEAIAASRDLTVELSPPVLHEAGLGPALTWLAGRMATTVGFAVEVRADRRAEPDAEDVRLLLFEAVRELLLNALKHSGVLEARVTLGRTPDGRVQMTVEDPGAGFDPLKIRTRGVRTEGFGLFGIEQRVAHAGGRMLVEATPGAGTKVTVRMPAGRVAPAGRPRRAPHAVQTPSPGRSHRGPVRVLLVDDHAILRQGLSSLLGLEPDIAVVGEAGDGEEAVRLARELHPDVVIMDVNLPGMGGVEATGIVVRENPYAKVIGLSMHADADVADAMRRAGAVAYLTKGGPSGDLVLAIRACAARSPSPGGNPPTDAP